MADTLIFRQNQTIMQRLITGSKVVGECLEYYDTDKLGYGHIRIKLPDTGKYRTMLAHRVSYRAFKGEIPEGLVLDHLCSNPSCINPEHLEAVTQRENVLRGKSSPITVNANKSRCIRGHDFNLVNTYLRKDRGTRECKTCRAKAYKLYIANLKARV